MYRGEPVSLWTNIMAILMILPLSITGLFNAFNIDFIGLHYQLAIFLVLGLIIMGSELQFFKALTGLRRYKNFRKLYIVSMVSSTFLIIAGNFIEILLIIGYTMYILMIIIHFYWINSTRKSKFFKFPLNYYYTAQIYFILGIVLFLFDVSSQKLITHIFTIGFLGLTLQGALIRILPMFIGKSLNAKSKDQLDTHFKMTLLSTLIIIIGFALDFKQDYILGFIMYMGTWLWTIIILYNNISIGRKMIHKSALIYFVPGLIYFLSGMFIGIFNINRVLHIHLSFFGLIMIIMGAAHRIIIFQIYSIIFTGRRKEESETRLMFEGIYRVSGILINISVFQILVAFIRGYRPILFIIGGFIGIIGLFTYYSIIIYSIILYIRKKSSSIPFYLTASELSSNNK